MQRLLLTLLTVTSVTLLATPTLGAGWIWDIGNGLGFVAFAGLLYLSKFGGCGENVSAHQLLGFTVLGVTTAHVYWFLLFDAVVMAHIKAGGSVYMWMGILGFVLLAMLIFISLPERRIYVHKSYAVFKYGHRVLALATIMGAGYHIVASGFYLNTSYQVVFFLILVAAALSSTQYQGSDLTPQTSWMFLVAGTLCVVSFAGIRNISF
jgi:hypothetical protein|tara:strand:- start:13674 stop:14297 length:624 start_codon:yes stop_codon:yes gene_type:complete